MKKNKSHKKNYHTQNISVKRSFFTKVVRNIGLVFLLISLFFSSMYGFRCLVQKICEVEFIDKFVRHDATVLMPKGSLDVEVANTKSSRELGLSFRQSMRNDEGLLFVFDTPGRYGFWMKDMNFPLDIIWINQNGVVVDIERNLSPDSYPKAFINEAEASYVLEVNAGLAETFGLYLGSKVKITN